MRAAHIPARIFVWSANSHRKKFKDQLLEFIHIGVLEVMPDQRIFEIPIEDIIYDFPETLFTTQSFVKGRLWIL